MGRWSILHNDCSIWRSYMYITNVKKVSAMLYSDFNIHLT